MACHFVHAALPLACIPVFRVVKRPDLTMKLAQYEVTEGGATAIVNQHQRRRRASSLVRWKDLDLGRVGAVDEHGEEEAQLSESNECRVEQKKSQGE